MRQYLTVFALGNGIGRVRNQWYRLKCALLKKCASLHGIRTLDGEVMI